MTIKTKVLIPVMAVMSLLLAAILWVMNQQIAQELENNAARQLVIAEAVLRNSAEIRAKQLLLRYQSVAEEPKFKALAHLGDAKTMEGPLHELLESMGGDHAQFTALSNRTLISTSRKADFPSGDFPEVSAASIQRALDGHGNTDLVSVDKKVYDVISVPVRIGTDLIGVFTFAASFDAAAAQEFKKLTHSEVALLVKGKIAASTFQEGAHATALDNFVKANRKTIAQPGNALLGDEHYFHTGGLFKTVNGHTEIGYVLFSSYEAQLASLSAMQRTILLTSLVGILISAAVILIVIRKATQPLGELRQSAEAVGQGDFSRHVKHISNDESGELAVVFNGMIDNLKNSRSELEKTVMTLKTTQAQLVQSEKLSAIGEFVAGVTHELNNPLTSVIGFAELLQQTPVDSRSRRFLELIVDGAHRCHKIVQSLLSFARQHKPERKLVCIQELVQSAINILQYQMRTSNIEVSTDFAPDLPQVMADSHQIQQVFLNLINNARQAIEACRPKGAICITAVLADGTIRVSFKDDGPGISEENLKKIFNPFFTTKEVGKGTGLGLSLSYGLIQEHGGSIEVQSKPGEGATFIVELPVATQSELSASAAESACHRPVILNGNNKRVLLVDDEEAILDLLRDALGQNGYELEVARDGEAALQNLRRRKYDLTICDWKMPGMNGRQLYEKLHATDPEAASRFLFMTGDVVSESTQEFFRKHKATCLEKPFSMEAFKRAVSSMTDPFKTKSAG
ncbi:MAG TPA: ATP-binding protein [Candidatus Saccharimonadales bacterium]|nr:ATP-binding protein [Candidatus Saccharimonadales bacterium]